MKHSQQKKPNRDFLGKPISPFQQESWRNQTWPFLPSGQGDPSDQLLSRWLCRAPVLAASGVPKSLCCPDSALGKRQHCPAGVSRGDSSGHSGLSISTPCCWLLSLSMTTAACRHGVEADPQHPASHPAPGRSHLEAELSCHASCLLRPSLLLLAA